MRLATPRHIVARASQTVAQSVALSRALFSGLSLEGVFNGLNSAMPEIGLLKRLVFGEVGASPPLLTLRLSQEIRDDLTFAVCTLELTSYSGAEFYIILDLGLHFKGSGW